MHLQQRQQNSNTTTSPLTQQQNQARQFRVPGGRPINIQVANNTQPSRQNPTSVQSNSQSHQPRSMVNMAPGGIRAKRQQAQPNYGSSPSRKQNRDQQDQYYQPQPQRQMGARQRSNARQNIPSAGAYQKRNLSKAGTRSQIPSSQYAANNAQPNAAHHKEPISTNVINYLKEELLQTWESYLIPDYHRTVFLDCIYGLNANQYSPIIAKEIEDLQEEQAPIQKTIQAIIARESCISQINELSQVIDEAMQKAPISQKLLEECVNMLHSLRMLSIHVIECIIQWRKQLIFNYLLTQSNGGQQAANTHSSRNNLRKFKCIPFVWEQQNYLLKMKTDTAFLGKSSFANHFNFSNKSDPFLVFPSSKHNASGTGINHLKKLSQNARGNQTRINNGMVCQSKMVIPLPNSLMKIIRKSEVYLMEEAVTEQIIKSTSNNDQNGKFLQKSFNDEGKENSNPDQMNNVSHNQMMRKNQQSSSQQHDIVDIKTFIQTKKQEGDQYQQNQNIHVEQQRSSQGNFNKDDLMPISDQFKQQEQAQISQISPSKAPNAPNSVSEDLVIIPANLQEDTLPQFLADYYKEIDQKWRDSFCAADKLPTQALNGLDARFMLFMQNNKIQGLFVYNCEYHQIGTMPQVLKANIVHVSTIENQNQNQDARMLDMALEHLWNYTACASIRLCLLHYKQPDGKLAANPEFKVLLKERKFKWKTLQNIVSTGERLEILECPRPQNIQISCQEIPESFTIDLANCISIGETSQSRSPQKASHQNQVISTATVIENLIAFKQASYADKTVFMGQIAQESQHQSIKETLLKGEISLQQGGDLQASICQHIQSNYLSQGKQLEGGFLKKFGPMPTTNSNIVSECVIKSRLQQVDACELDTRSGKYACARVKQCKFTAASTAASSAQQFKKVLIMQNPSEEHLSIIFLIKSDNCTITSDNMNQEIHTALQSMKEIPDEEIQQVWIPQFCIDQQYNPQLNNLMTGFKVTEDSSQQINECFQSARVEIIAPPSGEGSLKLSNPLRQKQTSSTYVIQDAFFMAVMHNQIEDSLDVPLLIANVDQINWIKLQSH